MGSAVIRQRDPVWRYDYDFGENVLVFEDKSFCLNHVPARGNSMLDDTELAYQGGCVFRNCGQLLSKPALPGSDRLWALVPMLYHSELSRLLYEIEQLCDSRSALEQEGASMPGQGESPEGQRGQETQASSRPALLPFAAELVEERSRGVVGRTQGADGAGASAGPAVPYPGPGVPYPARTRPPYPEYYD